MKVFLKILASLLIIIGLLLAIIRFLPDEQYQSLAQISIEKLTGRQLELDQLTTNRTLNPSIEVQNLTLSNPQWAQKPNLISAKNVYMSFDLRQLFKGHLVIHDLSADSIDLDLVKNKQGQVNWQLVQPKSETKTDFDLKQLSNFALEKFDLNQSQFSYVDEQARLKYRLELPQMTLTQNEAGDSQLISANGFFNQLPFSIDGHAGLFENLANNKILPFDLKTVLNQSKVNIEGDIDPNGGGLYLNTQLAASTKSLSDLSVFTPNPLPAIGPIDISAGLAGDFKSFASHGFDVKNLDVRVSDPEISLDMKGDLSGMAVTNQGDVDIDLNVTDLNKLLGLFGLDKDFPGKLTLKAQAKGSGDKFGLEISQANLDSEFLTAKLSGNIKDLLNGVDSDVELNVSAPNLQFITQLFGQDMPPEWGPITASAKVVGNNNNYALQDIQAQLNSASTATVTGSIKNLIKFNGMNLQAQVNLASLKEISAFTRSQLPDIGPITATGNVTWQDGKLALVDAVSNYQGRYGKAKVIGGIGDLINFDIVRLKVDTSVPNLDIAKIFSGVEMPEIGDIHATADLISPTSKDLSARNVIASYDNKGIKVNAVGSIESMIKRKADLNLDLTASLDSLNAVNPIFNLTLPRLGPITATGKLQGITKDIQLVQMNALVSDKDLYGSIKGDLGNLVTFKDIDLIADVSTPSVKRMLKRLDLDSDVDKNANLETKINYDQGAIHFIEAELNIGSSNIIGDLSLLNYLDKKNRPTLTGQINLLNFDVLEVSKNERKPKVQNRDGKLLSRSRLPYDFIENTDLDIKLNIGRLRGKVFDLTNSSIPIKANNGMLAVGPFKGKLSGGDSVFKLDINTKIKPTMTSLKANVRGFDMGQASVFRDSKQIESSGDAYMTIELNGVGRTIASIMANANGGGLLYFENLLLKPGTLDLFTSDLIIKTLNAINPFKKKKRATEIKCAGFAFKIKDGKFTTPHGVAAQAKEFSVTGNSKVNFKTEAIDFEFKTKVKKVLAINPFEKLAGLVKVTGEMSNPAVTLNPKGILEIGATVGAALATGGISYLAQDQIEKLQAKSELCAKALGSTSQL